MNMFNEVFISIKDYCNKKEIKTGSDCFEEIAQGLDLSVHQLDFYLSTLQTLELIKYSWNNKTIQLTAFGKKQDRLFA